LKTSPVLLSIPYDVIKSSMAMFLNEVLYKSIRQQTADENLFDLCLMLLSGWIIKPWIG
jgi:DNA repair protein RecO (recombination protein O)